MFVSGAARYLVALVFVGLGAPRVNKAEAAECDIAGVYRAVVPEPGTLAVTSLGDPQTVTTLLVPVKLDPGRYAVSLTREASDLYKSMEGLYLRTRYCYEFVYYQDSVVEIVSSGLYASGTITFRR